MVNLLLGIQSSSIIFIDGECSDGEGWHDADGEEYDCKWYAVTMAYLLTRNAYEVHHSDTFGNFGQTANIAFCACKIDA
jgi:hypothetical protein